jgi:hypothetical protein
VTGGILVVADMIQARAADESEGTVSSRLCRIGTSVTKRGLLSLVLLPMKTARLK